MSSIQAGLFPDKVLLVVQGGVYLAALAVAHVLIIKPALRLQAERLRRTAGKKEQATAATAAGEASDARWNLTLKEASDEARRARGELVSQGQAEAQHVLHLAGDQNRARLAAVRAEVDAALTVERQRLPDLVEDVVKTIFTKLGVASGIVVGAGLLALSHSSRALASAGKGGAVTMDNFVWPYFQFILFAFLIYFAGKKVIPGMLAARREKLKADLAEAQVALEAAESRAQMLAARLTTVEHEVEELRTRYQEEGVREREMVVADAKRLADQMKIDAERVVRETLTQGREKLRRELLDLAIRTVEERLTSDKLATLDVQLKKSALDSVREMPVG